MAAASDLLPSPGAPVTAGTKAATWSSLPMLLVVVLDVCVAAGPCLVAVRGVRGADSVAPIPAGCPPVLKVVATAPCPLWVCSQATKLLAALPETDCATDGVIAAHGSLDA